MRRFLFLLSIIILLGACSSGRRIGVQPQKVGDELMLLGDISYEDILNHFPDWQAEDEQTETDPLLVARLKKIDQPVTVVCFLGTWCSDSRHGVPPFIRHVIAAANPNIHIQLVGVDRQKDDPQHKASRELVERVPTFVVTREGMLLGRMVEFPASENFTEDFLSLLNIP